MKYTKVIAKKDLPARFPFGFAAFLLWIADKIQSPLFFWLVMVGLLITAIVTLLRQFSEIEVELKDCADDHTSEEQKSNSNN